LAKRTGYPVHEKTIHPEMDRIGHFHFPFLLEKNKAVVSPLQTYVADYFLFRRNHSRGIPYYPPGHDREMKKGYDKTRR